MQYLVSPVILADATSFTFSLISVAIFMLGQCPEITFVQSVGCRNSKKKEVKTHQQKMGKQHTRDQRNILENNCTYYNMHYVIYIIR